MAKEFSPHQYILDAGWDYSSIEDTATLGVADADRSTILAMVEGAEVDGDPALAIAALHTYCVGRLAAHE